MSVTNVTGYRVPPSPYVIRSNQLQGREEMLSNSSDQDQEPDVARQPNPVRSHTNVNSDLDTHIHIPPGVLYTPVGTGTGTKASPPLRAGVSSAPPALGGQS